MIALAVIGTVIIISMDQTINQSIDLVSSEIEIAGTEDSPYTSEQTAPCYCNNDPYPCNTDGDVNCVPPNQVFPCTPESCSTGGL